MATASTAEEHLRVIRSLMEKATIYRAISAPTALVGGCAGILASFVFRLLSERIRSAGNVNHLFLGCWLSALAIAGVGNIYFLRADAHRRGEKFISSGMRAALRALLPSYLVAAVVTFLLRDAPEILPIPWMLFYGLGLLATQHFAPRSIAILGWAFLAAALLGLVAVSSLPLNPWNPLSDGNLAMGITFGAFHVIYAACAWPRQRAQTTAGNVP